MMKRAYSLAVISAMVMPLMAADPKPEERITAAADVFREIMASGDKQIPQDLLEKAQCMVIVPSLKKGGFIVGGQYGVGVAACRKPGGAGWTAPSTVRMEGGSLGFQIGGGEVDIIMAIMNKAGIDKLMSSKFTLGGEGGVMAGPVGRSSSAETDAFMRAEILSWSRSRGVFGGIAIKGSTLRPDDDANKQIYGKAIEQRDILTGKVAAPAAAQPLLAQLSKYSLKAAK